MPSENTPITARHAETEAETEPEAAESHPLVLALEAHKTGDLDQAIIICRRFLREDPAHADTLQVLGVFERLAGNAEEAESLLRRSLIYNPTQPHVWNNLATILLENFRLGEAADAAEAALEVSPDYLPALGTLSRIASAQGQIV